MADIITINVGGTKFVTKLATLTKYPDSMLAKMFDHGGIMEPMAKHENGEYFLDVNPKDFEVILDFLRLGTFKSPISKGISDLASYFGLEEYLPPPSQILTLVCEDGREFMMHSEDLDPIKTTQFAQALSGDEKALENLKIVKLESGKFFVDAGYEQATAILKAVKYGESVFTFEYSMEDEDKNYMHKYRVFFKECNF